MQVNAGQDFTTSLIDPAGDVGDLGARVEVPVTRAIASHWVPAVLDGSVWTVTLEAPLSPGDYELVWMNGNTDPPVFTAFVPLAAVAPGTLPVPADFPEVDESKVRPSVDEVAQLAHNRAVEQGGDMAETFNDNTEPTSDQAASLIDDALEDILAQLPVPEINPAHYPRVKRAVAMQTVLLIELSFYRESAEDHATQMWRQQLDTTITGLRERIQRDLDQESLIGGLV